MDDAAQSAYRRDLVSREWALSDAYDKLVMALAGGAMVASFAFLTDLGSDPVNKTALALGWFALVYSLSAKLYSHWFGAWAHRRAMVELDAGTLGDTPGGWRGWLADALDASAGVALVAGLAGLAFFAFANL